MCFSSSGIRPKTVFSTQAKESATDPTATRFTIAFGMRRPKIPLIRNPMSGRMGMSQRFIMMGGRESESLEFHRIDFVDFERSAVFENGENDRQADGGFGGGHNHYEEAEDMAVDPMQF